MKKYTKILFLGSIVSLFSLYFNSAIADNSIKKPVVIESHSNKKSTTLVVNINQANAKMWQQLPHVGPKLADRIVTYRSQHGSFKTVEDLLHVKGVTKKLLASLNKQLVVSP